MELGKVAFQSLELDSGYILKLFNAESSIFTGFGEAYVSSLNFGSFRGFKKHREQNSILFVLEGRMSFHFIEDDGYCHSLELGSFLEDRAALTIPAGTIFGFKATSESGSTLMNISNIVHDDGESERFRSDSHSCDWTK